MSWSHSKTNIDIYKLNATWEDLLDFIIIVVATITIIIIISFLKEPEDYCHYMLWVILVLDRDTMGGDIIIASGPQANATAIPIIHSCEFSLSIYIFSLPIAPYNSFSQGPYFTRIFLLCIFGTVLKLSKMKLKASSTCQQEIGIIVDHLSGWLTTDASILTFSFPGALGMLNENREHGSGSGHRREVHLPSTLSTEL